MYNLAGCPRCCCIETVGAFALDACTTGSNNTAGGGNALGALTSGGHNTAFGKGALDANTSASDNTAFGSHSLGANSTGYRNVAVGREAMFSNTTAIDNTAVGTTALYSNTTGNANTGVGRQAIYTNTTGSNNTAVGYNALDDSTTASNNTAVGKSALKVGLPQNAPITTKNYEPSNMRTHLRRVRSGGCTAPAKKGSIFNQRLRNGRACAYGSIVRNDNYIVDFPPYPIIEDNNPVIPEGQTYQYTVTVAKVSQR